MKEMEERTVKIVCNNGIGRNVIIQDADTGEDLKLPVTEIKWEVKTGEFSKLTLKMEASPANIDAKIVEIICNGCPHYPKESL